MEASTSQYPNKILHSKTKKDIYASVLRTPILTSLNFQCTPFPCRDQVIDKSLWQLESKTWSVTDPLKRQTASAKENNALKSAYVPNNSNKINEFQYPSQKNYPFLRYKKLFFSLKTANLTTTTKKKIMVSLQANY